MTLPELALVPYQKLADPIAIEFDNSLCENEQFKEDNYLAVEERAELNKKQIEIYEELDDSCNRKKGNDPSYELFWDSKVCDESCIIKVEENGVCVFIEYEGYSGSDIDDVEPKRMLRSAMNKNTRPSNRIAGVENQHKNCSEPKLIGRRLRNKSKSEKGKSVVLSNKNITWECGYLSFSQNLKVIADYTALEFEGLTVVYEQQMDEENNHEKEEYNDGSFSDVEYLGSTSDMEGNTNCPLIELEDDENDHEKGDYNDNCVSDVKTLEGAFSKMNEGSTWYLKDIAKYRENLISVLTKPYNQQEYDSLFQDIEFRRPEERHLELRNGKEISYLIKKEGKCYLDHYPDFERKLLQVQHDKPKCLNLLRGFFFWLKRPGPLLPWVDADCLATEPGSG